MSIQSSNTPGSSKTKYWLVAGFTVVVVAVIIVLTWPWNNTPRDTSGTIGPVKKYGSVQMSERDIKLRNALLKDRTTLKSAIDQLRLLKVFAARVNNDMTRWGDELAAVVSKVQLKVERRGYSPEQKIRDFRDYADFITFNGRVIDTTLMMLTAISESDTLEQGFAVERTLNDFENFRARFTEKFRNAMIGIPDVHNLLVNNGLNTVFITNAEGALGFILSTEQGNILIQHDQALLGDNPLGVIYMAPQELGGSFIFSKPEMLGYVYCGGSGGQGGLGHIEIVESSVLGVVLYQGFLGTLLYGGTTL